VDYVTPERMLAPAVGSMNSPAYLRAFDAHEVTVTLGTRLTAVERATGGGLVARLRNDELYFELVPASSNGGAVDHPALLDVRPQPVAGRGDGGFQLFRIGDAVASRNIHAAVYDALRLCLAV
jgi:hypothetical protein